MSLRKISKITFLIIFILIVGGIGGILADRYFFPYLSSAEWFSKYEWLKKSTAETTIINKTEQVYVKEETSITKIAQNASSSVVNIASISKNIQTTIPRKTGPASPVQNTPTSKNGAGLIFTSDGLIVTYASAIITENASYKIMTATGDSYDGELVGIDNYSNLAFIKINASNIPAASFGNSDDIKAGEKVIAIGNNQGNFQDRFAAGLISQYANQYNISGLTVASSEKLEGVFQTDFNSEINYVGGPIVDYTGNIIGLVGAVTKDNSPEYFQIPSNKVKMVIEKAIKKQIENQAKLGVYYLPVNDTLAVSMDLARNDGAYVYSASGQTGLAVIASSPAQKAGIKAGDIIIAVGSDEIDWNNSLSGLINKYSVGDQIDMKISRSGQEMTLKVQL